MPNLARDPSSNKITTLAKRPSLCRLVISFQAHHVLDHDHATGAGTGIVTGNTRVGGPVGGAAVVRALRSIVPSVAGRGRDRGRRHESTKRRDIDDNQFWLNLFCFGWNLFFSSFACLASTTLVYRATEIKVIQKQRLKLSFLIYCLCSWTLCSKEASAVLSIG